MKNVTIGLLLLIISGFASAQNSLSSFDSKEVFGNKGEIYFVLKGAAGQTSELTKIISIDNIKDGDVYAYASVKEFEQLKAQFDYPFIQLPKPSEIDVQPMTDDSRQVLDWNYYPTYTAYLQLMQDFATNFPEICKIDTIGLSVEGRLLLAARISDNVGIEEDEPEFLYTSSIHGDETTGYVLMLHLIDYLLTNYGVDDRLTNIVNNMDIWINPLANPDGTYASGNNSVNGATRYNANFVDMNRNYPDPQDGPHPDGNEWQVETIAFMQFAESRDFVISANFHGGAEVANYPWDTWSRLTADDNWWQYVARQYADTVHENAPFGYMNYLNNGITNGYAWYEVAGGRQDYMNYFQQCREMTLEISDIKLLPANQLINHWNYNYRSLLNYLEQGLYGLRGIITDTITGEPIHAQVFISGHDADSSMVFSSLPIGNYHRLLKSGTYNIIYFADGYLPKTRKNVVVNDLESTIVNVQLWNGNPIPMFSSSDTLIAPGHTIQFFDNSSGSPTSRLWTFEGGTPSTSIEPNPEITYNQVGKFDVTLKVSNLVGSTTIVKDNYISVQEGVIVKDEPLINLTVFPNPSRDGIFTLTSPVKLKLYEVSDVTGTVIKRDYFIPGDYSINLQTFANGVYFLKVQDERNNNASMKIIIQN